MAIIKNGFQSLYLLSTLTFGLQLLMWAATDKSGFRRWSGKKIAMSLKRLLTGPIDEVIPLDYSLV